VGFLKWLYRLPGRVNGSFDTTAAATQVDSPTMLGPGVSAIGVRVVAQEVENASRTDEPRSEDADSATD
jgi:hypothetical protein